MLILLGVLRMPPDCWDDSDPISVAQRYARYCEAAWEIERLRSALEKIRDLDYRGNVHESHYIAKKALSPETLKE